LAAIFATKSTSGYTPNSASSWLRVMELCSIPSLSSRRCTGYSLRLTWVPYSRTNLYSGLGYILLSPLGSASHLTVRCLGRTCRRRSQQRTGRSTRRARPARTHTDAPPRPPEESLRTQADGVTSANGPARPQTPMNPTFQTSVCNVKDDSQALHVEHPRNVGHQSHRITSQFGACNVGEACTCNSLPWLQGVPQRPIGS